MERMRDILNLVLICVAYLFTVQCAAPTISPLSSNNDCQNCIIGVNASKLTMNCTVNSTTDPDNVTMKINDEVLHPIQHNDDHVVFVYLNSSKHHLEQLECTALYNTSNITTQATIYVIIMTYKAPSVILPNKLIEGTPANISCLVEDRRPAADNITMWIGGNLVEAAVTVQESSINGTLYNTWVTVTEIQRAWNKKNVTCCEYNTKFWTDDFKMCSKETDDVINYSFPPASVNLTLQLEKNITEEKPFTILTATCSIKDSNPKCDASWDTSNIKIMVSGEEKSTQNIDNGSMTSIFTAFMNVSASDDGKVITCSPNCTTKFNNMPSSSVVIQISGNSGNAEVTSYPEVDDKESFLNKTELMLIVGIVSGVICLILIVIITIVLKYKIARASKKQSTNDKNSKEMDVLNHESNTQPPTNDVNCGEIVECHQELNTKENREVAEGEQLTYIDVEFATNAGTEDRPVVKRRESQVNYVAIDIIKTSEIAALSNEDNQNIYVNQ
ncbi:hypothetical protein ACF0H5_012577 [Mactra antiquata]